MKSDRQKENMGSRRLEKIKRSAKTLSKWLKAEHDVHITHTKCLDVVARMNGAKTWAEFLQREEEMLLKREGYEKRIRVIDGQEYLLIQHDADEADESRFNR